MTPTLLMSQHEFAQQTMVENGLLKSLGEGLRAALTWDGSGEALGRKLSSVRFIFQSFQRHLDRLMKLEEVDGYMDSVLESNPHLSKQVSALKQDHERFRLAMGRIAQELERISTTDGDALVDVCDGIAALLDQVDGHTREEARLFLEAFEQEEGGEG